jgi:hypothetical protein
MRLTSNWRTRVATFEELATKKTKNKNTLRRGDRPPSHLDDSSRQQHVPGEGTPVRGHYPPAKGEHTGGDDYARYKRLPCWKDL